MADPVLTTALWTDKDVGRSCDTSVVGRLRRPFVQVEKQDLCMLPGRERDRALGPNPGAVARGQDGVAEGPLSLHEVEPRTSPLWELVDHVLPLIEDGRVHQSVLVDAQRSSSSVGRGDDAQHAPTFRHAEAPLLMAGLEPGLRGAQPDLEDVCPVGPRQIRMAVASAASGGHALELARVNDARATHRFLVGERALANVGDDLGIALGMAQDAPARRKTAFVEDLQASETVDGRVRSVLWIEREPDLPLAATVVVAILGPAERDHELTPKPGLSKAGALKLS